MATSAVVEKEKENFSNKNKSLKFTLRKASNSSNLNNSVSFTNNKFQAEENTSTIINPLVETPFKSKDANSNILNNFLLNQNGKNLRSNLDAIEKENQIMIQEKKYWLSRIQNDNKSMNALLSVSFYFSFFLLTNTEVECFGVEESLDNALIRIGVREGQVASHPSRRVCERDRFFAVGGGGGPCAQ
jgi:hypothetical protein